MFDGPSLASIVPFDDVTAPAAACFDGDVFCWVSAKLKVKVKVEAKAKVKVKVRMKAVVRAIPV